MVRHYPLRKPQFFIFSTLKCAAGRKFGRHFGRGRGVQSAVSVWPASCFLNSERLDDQFGTSSKIMNSNVELTLLNTGEYENGSERSNHLAKSSFSLSGWGGWTTSRNNIEGVAWTVFFSDIFLNGENTDISVMHIFRLNKRTSAQNIDRLPVVETSSWRKIRHDESRTDLVGNFCFWSFTLESEFLFI